MRHKSAVKWMAGAAVMLTAGIDLPAHAGKTLDAIKQRGQLVCGVNTGLAGFSAADSQGNWTGLDVDICRAIAAAVLGDAEQGEVGAAQRAAALHGAAVGRDRHPVAQHHLDADARCVARPRLHRRDLLRRPGLHGAEEARSHERQAAEERRVCVQSGTTTEKNLADYFKCQQSEDEDGRVRGLRSVGQGVLRRPLPGLHDRRVRPRLDAQQGSEAIPTTT